MYKGSIYNMLYLRMEMELEDVYADIDTPDGSDEEDDTSEMEVINVFVAKKKHFRTNLHTVLLFQEEQVLPASIQLPHPFPHLATLAHFNSSVEEMVRMMSAAISMPKPGVQYRELYTMFWYRKKCLAKLKLLKSLISPSNIERALMNNDFWRHLILLDHTYPKNGGRKYLYLLVGK